MSGFDDFLRQMSDGHRVREAEAADEAKRARDERDARWHREMVLLQSEALPLLQDAEAACKAQGLRPFVKPNWEHGQFMDPAIEFQVFGPNKRMDGSTYEVDSHKVIVKVEDDRLRSAVSVYAFKSTAGKGYVGYDADGLDQAIKFAIMSYYDTIDPKNN